MDQSSNFYSLLKSINLYINIAKYFTKNLIAIILISANFFIYEIPRKLINFERTIEVITSKNIATFIAIFLLFSSIFGLILGSILFISGFKQSLVAYLLLIFLIPTTFIFHFFPLQISNVLMNDGLVGGLILGLKKKQRNTLKNIFDNKK